MTTHLPHRRFVIAARDGWWIGRVIYSHVGEVEDFLMGLVASGCVSGRESSEGWDGIGNHPPRSDAVMSGTRVLDTSSRSVIEKSKGKTRMPRLT
jgi:hypothetical protein